MNQLSNNNFKSCNQLPHQLINIKYINSSYTTIISYEIFIHSKVEEYRLIIGKLPTFLSSVVHKQVLHGF